MKRVDAFLGQPLAKSLEKRADRAEQVLALDAAVVAAMQELKEKGFESPYLRAFVVARISESTMRSAWASTNSGAKGSTPVSR